MCLNNYVYVTDSMVDAGRVRDTSTVRVYLEYDIDVVMLYGSTRVRPGPPGRCNVKLGVPQVEVCVNLQKRDVFMADGQCRVQASRRVEILHT